MAGKMCKIPAAAPPEALAQRATAAPACSRYQAPVSRRQGVSALVCTSRKLHVPPHAFQDHPSYQADDILAGHHVRPGRQLPHQLQRVSEVEPEVTVWLIGLRPPMQQKRHRAAALPATRNRISFLNQHSSG